MRRRTELIVLIGLVCLVLAGLAYVLEHAAFAGTREAERVQVAREASIREATERQGVLRAQVDQAEQQWNRQGIRSYRIVVSRVYSVWHAQMNTIVVVDGQVTEQSATCTRAPAEVDPCKLWDFDPAEYTVPGLFAKARLLIDKASPEALTFTFDDTYGFPKSILSDPRNTWDNDQFWDVKSFTVLKDAPPDGRLAGWNQTPTFGVIPQP